MNEYLINKLKEGRVNKGLKQSEVTKFTGIKNTTLSNYENGVTEPDIDTFLQLCELYDLDYASILGEAYGLNVQGTNFDIKPSEMEHVKKYRSLDPFGQETMAYILDREIKRLGQIANMHEDSAQTIVEIQPLLKDNGRFINYFHSASAGTGVFIMGNEANEQIAIPNTEENRAVDYAIKVGGDSMLPDYADGDIVLVSQKAEIRHGNVGIFIINNNAYIKEYGESELISRNPNSDNIKIAEYDNIVCMGKVIGKLPSNTSELLPAANEALMRGKGMVQNKLPRRNEAK